MNLLWYHFVHHQSHAKAFRIEPEDPQKEFGVKWPGGMQCTLCNFITVHKMKVFYKILLKLFDVSVADDITCLNTALVFCRVTGLNVIVSP